MHAYLFVETVHSAQAMEHVRAAQFFEAIEDPLMQLLTPMIVDIVIQMLKPMVRLLLLRCCRSDSLCPCSLRSSSVPSLPCTYMHVHVRTYLYLIDLFVASK